MAWLIIVLLSSVLSAGASPLQDALQKLMDEKVADYQKKDVTGFQLSWKSGNEEFTVASGNAGSRKMSPTDTFLFGSGAKPFTAATIMKRWEAGKLDLNATVSHYVDAMFKAKLGKTFLDLYGPNATTMTVWHLVTMQSGIPDFDVPAFDDLMLNTSSTRAWTPLDAVTYAATQPWTCKPGECVYYTSTNYIILGYVLLGSEGKSVDDWTSFDQREVASLNTFPDLHFLNIGPVSKHLTVPGWSVDANGTEIVDISSTILGWTCGNLVGTSRGMAAWMWELLVSRTILGEKALDLMMNVRPISYGWGSPWLDYGAGLFVQQLDLSKIKEPLRYGDWGTTLGHGGDTYGFISDQGYIPQLNATWSWIANSDAGVSNFDVSCNIIKTAATVVLGKSPNFTCHSGSTQHGAANVEVIV